ncbi:hypothetical protein OS493_009861 [Desmophyllum pertusum]|uniref:Uncharacterized protein n=1 Tax=Desmophyllum pertusum TaxID=174260 RepID=A0A9X0CNA5_9CNID|nr:hypothetical protein OS493_009861 [Desmophyllum pertusum]
MDKGINENGKPKIQMCSLPKRKRQRYFLICGTCNVVSIAENAPIERKAAVKIVYIWKKKKSVFMAVREGQNEEKCTHRVEYSLGPKRSDLQDQDKLQGLTKGKVDRNGEGIDEEKHFIAVREAQYLKDLRSADLQDQDKLQSLSKGNVVRNGEGMDRSGSTKKTCWRGSSDDVDDQRNVDSCLEQAWSERQQSVFELNSFSSTEPPLCNGKRAIEDPQLHQVDAWKDSKEAPTYDQGNSAPKQRPSLTREQAIGSVESSQSQAQLLVENEAPTLTSLTEDRTTGGKQACNAPEIQINGAVAKPGWVEEDPARATSGISSNRWKRLSALKFKVNRIQGKRVERRDTVVVSEEYEMMMANLKLYGVM